MMGILSPDEQKRYARHIILPEVGVSGQQKLKDASVLLVGLGGLGSPVALYLAAAGVGRLGLIDHDIVDVTNLQRQIIHGHHSIGHKKVQSARDRLHDLNPHVRIDVHDTPLTHHNALAIISQYDIVADGSDNFPTRYLVNDACVVAQKPNIYASILRFEGQVTCFDARTGPCYRCLFPQPPPPDMIPNCAEGGVFGVLPGILGSLQATEVIKTILGIGESLQGKLLMVDALRMQFRTLHLAKDPECPVCSPHRTITSLPVVNIEGSHCAPLRYPMRMIFCGPPHTRTTFESNSDTSV